MAKKNKAICIIFFLAIISLATYVFFMNQNGSEEVRQTNIEPHRVIGNNDHLPLLFSSLGENSEFEGAFGLLLWAGRENTLEEDFPNGFSGELLLESPQSLITAHIGNGLPHGLEFILKMFYNYQEVSFKIEGAEYFTSEFMFTLDSRYQVEIPFTLDENLQINDKENKLTVGLFLSPTSFVAEDDSLEEFYGMALNFEIVYTEESLPLMLSAQPFQEAKEIDNLQYQGLMINTNHNPTADGVYLPPHLLQVQAGEQIELAFVARALGLLFEPLDEYLIVALLDWHQVAINGEPYLLIEVEDDGRDSGQFGTFYIDAPTTTGFYEFVAFLVPNPTSPNSWKNFFPLEMAFRFTIEVVE